MINQKTLILISLYLFSNNLLAQLSAPTQFVLNNCLTIADVDITGTGTAIVSGDDVAAPFSTPFQFRMPGNEGHKNFAAATNGYISNDPSDFGPDLSNDCPLPATPSTPLGTTASRMYPLHDDLVTSNIFVSSASIAHPYGLTSNAFVIYWDDVTHFGGGGPWDMAVVLWDNHDFAYVYGPGNPEDGNGSTTGAQSKSPNPTWGDDFGVTCNTTPIGFGTTLTSICIVRNAVPTLSTWAMIILGIFILTLGTVAVRNKVLTKKAFVA